MFGKKKIIVCSITHTGVTTTIFSASGKGLIVEKKIEGITFGSLRSQFGIKSVRLLLPEEDTYLKLLTFPKDTVITRALVTEKAKEIIPEPIVEGFMDWKQVQMGKDEVGVQVYVVKKEVLAPILSSADDAGIIVEACEPPSFAMARMASKVHEPFVLVYPPVKPEFICAVQEGKVLEVMSVDPLASLEDTKHTFIDYVNRMWGIQVKAIATNMPDPVVGLASKTEITGVDMDVLNIPTEETHTKEKKRFPLPVIVGIIVLLVGAIGFFNIRLWTSQKGKTVGDTVSPQVTSVLTPTPPPIVRSDVLVEVQNGSGVAGLAGKGKKVLEDAGYTNVTTANADTYDYEGVTVKGKTASIASFVVTDIKETYPSASASSTLLDGTSPVDALVILGKE